MEVARGWKCPTYCLLPVGSVPNVKELVDILEV